MRLTEHGHVHREAFSLMIYMCENHPQSQGGLRELGATQCWHFEKIWNSRDGVTPFGCVCPSCGGILRHAYFGSDVYAPNHTLHFGQKYWRDGTIKEAVEITRARLESMKGSGYELDEITAAKHLDSVKENFNIKPTRDNPGSAELRKGFPRLGVFGYEKIEHPDHLLDLTFAELRRVNRERCTQWCGDDPWDAKDKMIELLGELGEAANVMKKLHRISLGQAGTAAADKYALLTQLNDEIADVQICLDLLADELNINLAEVTVDKFNRTSVKVGLPQRLRLQHIKEEK